MAKSKPQTKRKVILLSIPGNLYRRFSRSTLRRECATDAEAIRSAIKNSMKGEGPHNEKSATRQIT